MFLRTYFLNILCPVTLAKKEAEAVITKAIHCTRLLEVQFLLSSLSYLMEDSRVAEMAQSDATQAHATAALMRTYWIQKLGLATLQAVGVSQSDLQCLGEEMNLTTVQSKLEEHRRHWVHQPTDAENKRGTALLDARFADAGLKALEGLYAEALEICEELLSNETEHGSSSIKSKIRVAGVQGLVHALKGEWQAARNLLVLSIVQGLEQFFSSDGNGDFFYDYVVLTLGEALGYLLIHMVESDGSTRDSLQSSAILNPCDKIHVLYPVLLFGFGLLGEAGKFEVTICNIERLMVDFARQLSRGLFGDTSSSCLCSYVHEKVAIVLSESKNKYKELMVMTDSFRLANSIRLAQSGGKSTDLESSCLDSLGDLGTEGGTPFLSLKTYSSALRLKLSLCAEIEADPEVQIFCERLSENIIQILKLEGIDAGQYPRHPADVMVFSLCIIAFLEMDQELEGHKEVTEAVSRFQHVMKGSECLSRCLSELANEYLKRGAYRKAAAIFLLLSDLSTDLAAKLALRNSGASLLDRAGDLGMAVEVMKAVTRASMQLDELHWIFRAVLYTSAAILFDKGGETDSAIGARDEACRIVCAHATSYEFSDCEVDLYLIGGMISFLDSYRVQRNWFAACKLIESMDVHIDKHFYGEPIWVKWQNRKHSIALKRGEENIAGEVLLLDYPFTDWDINSRTMFEIQKSQLIVQDYASRGRLQKVMKEFEKMLKLIQNLSSPRDKHEQELEVRIGRFPFYSSLVDSTHALEEMDKIITAVNSVEYQDIREGLRLDFVHCLCSHAANCYENGNVTNVERLMDLAKSKVSECKNALELAEVEFSEARMLLHDGQYVEAANKARPLMLVVMEEQRHFCQLDHEPISWLSFSSSHLLNEKLWFIECVYLVCLKNSFSGLLWAERSQQRFFMHQIYNQTKEIAIPNPSDLDECDQLLTTLICQTTKALRPKTSIIEYSHTFNNEVLNMYVVSMTPDGNNVSASAKSRHLPTWFKENGLPSHKSLQELIADAIDEQGPSIAALSILHALLIQSIEENLKGCDSLIFVPGHGCLAQIPFVALYDKTLGKHLIEDYNVAVVPSIVTLHRCLYRQFNFGKHSQMLVQNLLQDSSLELGPSEQSLKFGGHLQSNVAFIAGNPKPMGCGLSQLDGAKEEAKEVAALFKVNPCIGKDMTKQAVIEGLSISKVVLLATHGVVNNDYPHGCLILQASLGPTEVTSTSPLQPKLDKLSPCRPDEVASTSTSMLPPEMDMLMFNKQLNDVALTSTITFKVNSTLLITTEVSKGKGNVEEQEQDVLQHEGHQEGKQSLRLFEFSDKKTKQKRAEEAFQVLTAEEIVALKGGVNAGLVVLSACQSGLGEATTSEGLLGLGRALLLAGAISTILTLWKVNDAFTSRFIIDLFKELLIVEPQGRSVDECMRKIMLNMIREGQPLKHWAAFTIVGSPTMQLLKPDNNTWGASLLDKHSYHPFTNYNPCPSSCRVCGKPEEVSESSATIFDVSNIVDIESMCNISSSSSASSSTLLK